MLVAMKYNSTQINSTLSLLSPRNYLAVTLRQKEREKYKNKRDKKRAKGSLLLLPEREVCQYFFKTKNNYFPQSNLFQEK